jgi:hypothetical protein
MQINGGNQNAHYALVQALASGTPTIDAPRARIGGAGIADDVAVDGHYYAAKPPGLALLALPAFGVLDAAGIRTSGDPTRAIWALHLWAIVVPVVVMLVLLWWAAARLGGDGRIAVVALAVASPVLAYATMFFSHAASAAFGTAAFALLLVERGRAPDRRLLVAAGALAGYAVTMEPPLAIVGAVLGGYALARTPRIARGLAYGAGCLAGVLPLLLFDWWAFGSPFRLPYKGWREQHGRVIGGTYGLRDLPTLHSLDQLLLLRDGYLVVAPVTAFGIVGAVLLWRRARAEAAVLLAVPLAFAAFQLVNEFGGPGMARYVIPAFPFLALGVGVAFRTLPLAVVTALGISVAHIATMTATGPLQEWDGRWLHRLATGELPLTAASFAGITGAVGMIPFGIAVICVLAAAVARMRGAPLRRVDGVVTGACIVVWAALAWRASDPLGALRTALVALVLAAALGAALRPRPA